MNAHDPPADRAIPRVSIGVPVYNAADHIQGALDSLLAQTFGDFELIISNNASTDRTGEICQEYVRRDPRVRYLEQPENLGAKGNFDVVLAEARGDYFMWAAHDDRWHPTWLARTTAVLDEDPDCNLVFSHYSVRDLESGAEERHRVVTPRRQTRFAGCLTRILHLAPSMIYGLHRREVLQRFGFGLFDFADVHLVMLHVMHGGVRVIDDYLYTAGIRGPRKPWSLTHKRINRTIFLRHEYAALTRAFPLPQAWFLFGILCLVMLRNKIALWGY